MKKIVTFLKKNYIYVNITFLCLTIYVILFPIISIPMGQILPHFNECPYLRITGKPCPLCGGTRYIQGLPKIFTDITYLYHPFGVIIIVIFCEFLFRVYNIITRKKEKGMKWVEKDLIVHLILLICLNLYEIIFLILQQKKPR